jgi:hypothetical protein
MEFHQIFTLNLAIMLPKVHFYPYFVYSLQGLKSKFKVAAIRNLEAHLNFRFLDKPLTRLEMPMKAYLVSLQLLMALSRTIQARKKSLAHSYQVPYHQYFAPFYICLNYR